MVLGIIMALSPLNQSEKPAHFSTCSSAPYQTSPAVTYPHMRAAHARPPQKHRSGIARLFAARNWVRDLQYPTEAIIHVECLSSSILPWLISSPLVQRS